MENTDLRKKLMLELEDMSEKYNKLHDIIVDQENFMKLPASQQDLMLKQAQYMGGYITTLKKRIAIL